MECAYELNLIDDILLESITTSRDFIDFSNNLLNIDRLVESMMFTEAVKDNNLNGRKTATETIANIKRNTRDSANVYRDMVNLNYGAIKIGWTVISKAISYILAAIDYITKKISKIPEYIIRIGSKIDSIATEVKSKITGDITLNIAASDVEVIYKYLLIQRIKEYIMLASSLSKGEFWSNALNNHKKAKKGSSIKSSDMKLCKKMDNLYASLQNIEFKPTVIKMKDKNMVDIYFGKSKCIKFTDNYGKGHEYTYYEAISALISDLSSMKNELSNIHIEVGKKLKMTEANLSYNDLTEGEKFRLNTTITQISKVVALIGNFIKYVTMDLNTINNSIKKIQSARK